MLIPELSHQLNNSHSGKSVPTSIGEARGVLAKLAWVMSLGSTFPQASRTSGWLDSQTRSSPTEIAGSAREVSLKEALFHLGWQVLDRILQGFAGEAI